MESNTMKSRDLPTDQEIDKAFGGFNFGDNCRTPAEKARTLAKGLLDSVSGYSCGSTMREILVRLGLAKYGKSYPNMLSINITAYGRRCVLSAHKRLLQDVQRSKEFYQIRCEKLRTAQFMMRDPERKMVCDILANVATYEQPEAI
jgi:hypothetical protein